MVLLTIALVIFAYKIPRKVNAGHFCIYLLLFINSAFDTCKGQQVDALVVML